MFGTAMSLEAIARVDAAKGAELVATMDMLRLVRRIEDASDMESAGHLLEAISRIHPTRGVELRANLSPEVQAQFAKT